MKSNILFTVPNLDIIQKVKGLGITNFVYPLSFFSVGFLNTFALKEITEENSYLLINKVLNTNDCFKLKDILNNLPDNIKGIIFEDLGLIELCKDLKIEKILYNQHMLTNYKSINTYLKYVDTVIVSSDITEEEIDEIIKKASKKVSLFVFGPVSAMYSRRTLLTSHSRHFGVEYKNVKKLKNGKEEFIAVEDENGTVLYHMPFYNGLSLLTKEAKYYFYLPLFLGEEEILNVLQGSVKSPFDYGFLNTKTYYKIKDIKKEGK